MIRKVILILCFSLVSSCIEYAEPQSYLLPDGFTGAFVVVFNQKEGTPKEYENGKRIYRIPKNGVLFTQFDIDFRVFTPESSKTYYVDSLGRKIDSLQNIVMIKNPNNNANYILDGYNGGFSIIPESRVQDEVNSDSFPKVNWLFKTIGKASMKKDSLRGVARKKVELIKKELRNINTSD